MGFFELLDSFFGKIVVGLTLLFLSVPALPPVTLPPLLSLVATNTPPAKTAGEEKPAAPSPTAPAPASDKKPPVKKEPAASPPPPPAPVAVLPTSPPLPLAQAETRGGDLNTKARAALVNILCTGSGGPLRPTSGSGVIIDPRGVILTNAHVGQFLLLEDYPVPNAIECVIRTGSPARVTYMAELLYLPPQWIRDNAHKIVLDNPTGTGENDYALLLITGRTDSNSPMPTAFPFIAPDTTAQPDLGDEVLLAGYPAGFLDGATIQTNLYATSAFTRVREIFNFEAGGQVSLISIAGTILSQSGSSGGGVVRTDTGKLQGIIVTATQGATTGERDLRAITLLHINESLKKEGQSSLASLLAGDLTASSIAFRAAIAPTLTATLVEVLEK